MKRVCARVSRKRGLLRRVGWCVLADSKWSSGVFVWAGPPRYFRVECWKEESVSRVGGYYLYRVYLSSLAHGDVVVVHSACS